MGPKAKDGGFAYAPSQMRATAAYCAMDMVNGAVIQAFSASIIPLARSIGTAPEVLAKAVTVRQVGRVTGALGFMAYIEWVKRGSAPRPHLLLGIACGVLAAAATALPAGTSVAEVSALMGAAGCAYGFTDSACCVMLQWVWQDNPVRYRTAVSVCATTLTLGCLLSPLLVAASLSYTGGTAPAFYATGVTAAVICASLFGIPSPPQPPRKEDDAAEYSPRTQQRDQRLTLLLQVFVFVCLFVMVGTEHAFATWLPTYAVQRLGMTEAAAAVIASVFWTSLTAGRLVYIAVSTMGVGNWMSLLVCFVLSLLSSLLLHAHTPTALWLAAAGLGAGLSAAYPAAYTLPAANGVILSPRQLTVLGFGFGAGEAFMPWFAGVMMVGFGPSALEWMVTTACGVALFALCICWARVKVLKALDKKRK